MRTFLMIEAPSKTFELEIRLADGKPVIAIDLADLLNILERKPAKPSTEKSALRANISSKSTKSTKKRMLM
ncbi:MAG: hypothetical protein A2413_03905 [Treponema sp. RIFOXYC1_FULL_61_9]|nr:MAG: hypothetical protein A2413_03905 [Treponema sp. RIFOXYC1_FULL_61_9]